MMIALDAGNTRIKWGVHDGGDWIARGALLTAEVAELAGVCAAWPAQAQLVGCNVAGAAVEQQIDAAVASRFAPPLWLRACAQACGVRNGYEQPERLGADRWAALIAARQRGPGAALVVCAGTATTVDWLDAQGVFRGGLILPGFDLMRASLAENTAQLSLCAGEFSRQPRQTADAIASGCLLAQTGAIEKMFAQARAESPLRCLLTGGAALRLREHLDLTAELVECLILDGLVCFGRSR